MTSREDFSSDATLEAMEAQLTSNVPSILEAMNSAVGKINTLDREICMAEQQFQERLHSRTQSRRPCTQKTPMSKTPSVIEVKGTANQRVQDSISEFANAVATHSHAVAELRYLENELAGKSLDEQEVEKLARATFQVMEAETKRDSCDKEYVQALRCYEGMQAAPRSSFLPNGMKFPKDSAGLVVESLLTLFPSHRQDLKLAMEQRRIYVLKARAQRAKDLYSESLRRLDYISNSVHELRRAHEQAEEQFLPAASVSGNIASDGDELAHLSPFSVPNIVDARMSDNYRAAAEASIQKRSTLRGLVVSEMAEVQRDDANPFA